MTLFDTEQRVQPSGLADLDIRRWQTPLPFPSWYEGSRRPVRVVVANPPQSPSHRAKVPAWVGVIIERLATLMVLPAGWDGRVAAPLSEDVARRALIALAPLMAEDSPLPAVVPTRSGGIQFEWHEVDFDVEIVLGADGPVDVFIEDYRTGAEFDGPLSVMSSLVRETLAAGNALA